MGPSDSMSEAAQALEPIVSPDRGDSNYSGLNI